MRGLRKLGLKVRRIDSQVNARPTAILFYWREDDYSENMADGPAYHLNRSQQKLHDLEIGDSLWAFTHIEGGRYVLAAELVICAKTLNDGSYEYDRYRVWGDPAQSRYFDVEEQEGIEPLIRDMFQPTTKMLAQSFQGPGGLRELSKGNDARLRKWASSLRTLDSDDRNSAVRTEALLQQQMLRLRTVTFPTPFAGREV